jgi:hypothetical protein
MEVAVIAQLMASGPDAGQLSFRDPSGKKAPAWFAPLLNIMNCAEFSGETADAP